MPHHSKHKKKQQKPVGTGKEDVASFGAKKHNPREMLAEVPHRQVPSQESRKPTKIRYTPSSNASRYCDDESSSFKDVLDFGSLGSHFRFKSEKTWDFDSWVPLDNSFSLNMDQLGRSLKCIALTQRLRMQEDEFPPDILPEVTCGESRVSDQPSITPRSKISSVTLPAALHRTLHIATMKPIAISDLKHHEKEPPEDGSGDGTMPNKEVAKTSRLTSLEEWLDSVLDD